MNRSMSQAWYVTQETLDGHSRYLIGGFGSQDHKREHDSGAVVDTTHSF
jgi:hypothetical protein